MPVIQMSSGLSVRTYEPAPAGFDPLTAPDNLLLHHGFPTRPDPGISPELYKRWERAVSGELIYIVPTFHELKGMTLGPRLKSPTEAPDTALNWSGSVVFPPNSSVTLQWIEGRWTVPNPYPSTLFGWDYAGEWIGIDGDGSDDVFQAGTLTVAANQFSGSGYPDFILQSIFAWWEWFPADVVAISNFPVAPGDQIWCLLCANDTVTGSVYLKNLGSRRITSFTINSPPWTTLKGNSAEWVVERPKVDGSLAALANYGIVHFDECHANYATGVPGKSSRQNLTEIDLGSGTLITMVGNNNASLSVPIAESPTSMRVIWEGAS